MNIVTSAKSPAGFRHPDRPHVSFPLTPALSLGERENRWPRLAKSGRSGGSSGGGPRPPLPKGEGWGVWELGSRFLHGVRMSETVVSKS
jgi:hypothetical protein